MKKSNKRGSVFTLLLGNYILLTLLLMVLLTTLFIGLLQKMNGVVSEISLVRISEYNQVLAEQRYEEFPIKRLLGLKGGILILDEQLETVFQSGEQVEISDFDEGEIACIPECGADLEKLNIPLEVLTKRQVQLLSDSFSDVYSIRKYLFQTEDGANYTMLLRSDRVRPDTEKRLVHSIYFFLFLVLLIYGATTVLFVLFLNRKIKKPLRLLGAELNNFKSGEKLQSGYRGPKEFVEIFDSFEAMSKRLQHSEEERARLEDARQKMLADISHDLRTPIAVVQGYAKALQDGVIPPAQQAQYLRTIEQKASGLNDLINTFYEYSKMEHPDYMLKLISGDVCNMLRDYVADWYAELELAGFLVEVSIPEKHISCNMDIAMMQRAFDNIVNNCIRHNPKGTTLSVSLTPEEDRVRIVFADDGVGIPAELRETIFTPFVVGEASRSKQGSGLGLAITKKIIEAHHGRILLLQSEASKGTAYEIVLPTI